MKTLSVKVPDIFSMGVLPGPSLHGATVSPVGMTLPDLVNEGQWNEIGDQVMRLDSASNWIIGDWWAFGQQAYGERKKWLQEQKAKRAQVKSFKTLRNIANVCRAYERSRRRDVVSFEMHKDLAHLPEAKQDKFLDQIEAGEIKTHKELREKLAPFKKKKGGKGKKASVLQYKEGAAGKTYQIDDPLPTWHIMIDDQHNNQIGCTACWRVFGHHFSMGLGLLTKSNKALDLDRPEFSCGCEDGTRSGFTIKEKI